MRTRSFNELVQRHVAEDPAFAEALLREGVDELLAFRDYRGTSHVQNS
jgi:hypothetical protein